MQRTVRSFAHAHQLLPVSFTARSPYRQRGIAVGILALVVLTGYACDFNLDGLDLSGPYPPPPKKPPVISEVSWIHQLGCSPGDTTLVTMRTTATDPDTDAGDLVYTGLVTGCTGTISSASSTVTSPQTPGVTYSGWVTVTDKGGKSDTIRFSFGPCENGSVDG